MRIWKESSGEIPSFSAVNSSRARGRKCIVKKIDIGVIFPFLKYLICGTMPTYACQKKIQGVLRVCLVPPPIAPRRFTVIKIIVDGISLRRRVDDYARNWRRRVQIPTTWYNIIFLDEARWQQRGRRGGWWSTPRCDEFIVAGDSVEGVWVIQSCRRFCTLYLCLSLPCKLCDCFISIQPPNHHPRIPNLYCLQIVHLLKVDHLA
jgi:hypothetical protein